MREPARVKGRWLHVAEAVVAAPPDGSDVGEVIRWYRLREGLTQQDAAALLNTTQSRLSKLEKGSQALRDVVELRHIASKLGIPPERLGVLPDRSGDAIPRAETVSLDPGPVREGQERWQAVRAQMNGNRALLGDLASELYPQEQRIPGTSVLTADGWVPDEPVDLAAIELQWFPESPPPEITGKVPEAAGSRALLPSGVPYDRYSRALRDLARPKLLDNRVSYRLLSAEWAAGRGSFGFNYTSYFDVLDVGEAVGHEFAGAWLDAEHDGNSVDPIDHLAEEPFASFERARLAGDFRVSALALVLEPLTLWVELLTVAVIEAPVFDVPLPAVSRARRTAADPAPPPPRPRRPPRRNGRVAMLPR